MATINETFMPIEAIHPTELIADELKARGMSQKELAERLGMKAPNLSRFLRNKENITPAFALRLEAALGIPADYWMRLQLSYERDLKQIDDTERIKKALASPISIPHILQQLGIESVSNLSAYPEEERNQFKASLYDLARRIRHVADTL